jgi:hypothetical protein
MRTTEDLDKFARSIKADGEAVESTFEPFLKRWMNPIFDMVVGKHKKGAVAMSDVPNVAEVAL